MRELFARGMTPARPKHCRLVNAQRVHDVGTTRRMNPASDNRQPFASRPTDSEHRARLSVDLDRQRNRRIVHARPEANLLGNSRYERGPLRVLYTSASPLYPPPPNLSLYFREEKSTLRSRTRSFPSHHSPQRGQLCGKRVGLDHLATRGPPIRDTWSMPIRTPQRWHTLHQTVVRWPSVLLVSTPPHRTHAAPPRPYTW